VAAGSAVSLVSGTAKNVTSISLTAGDWDVGGNVSFTGGATTETTFTSGSISTTTNTMITAGLPSYTFEDADITNIARTQACGTRRVSLASTTTVYLVARAGFNISTLTAFGAMTARRVR